MRLLRIALQAVLFFLLLAIVMAIGASETGIVEKVALAVIGAGLVWVAVRVRQIGTPHGPRSA
jgi:hypothetical protein